MKRTIACLAITTLAATCHAADGSTVSLTGDIKAAAV
jgi:hypothetical protein